MTSLLVRIWVASLLANFFEKEPNRNRRTIMFDLIVKLPTDQHDDLKTLAQLMIDTKFDYQALFMLRRDKLPIESSIAALPILRQCIADYSIAGRFSHNAVSCIMDCFAMLPEALRQVDTIRQMSRVWRGATRGEYSEGAFQYKTKGGQDISSVVQDITKTFKALSPEQQTEASLIGVIALFMLLDSNPLSQPMEGVYRYRGSCAPSWKSMRKNIEQSLNSLPFEKLATLAPALNLPYGRSNFNLLKAVIILLSYQQSEWPNIIDALCCSENLPGNEENLCDDSSQSMPSVTRNDSDDEGDTPKPPRLNYDFALTLGGARVGAEEDAAAQRRRNAETARQRRPQWTTILRRLKETRQSDTVTFHCEMRAADLQTQREDAERAERQQRQKTSASLTRPRARPR